jgi:ABC-type multidrug transport system ATPase subunit
VKLSILDQRLATLTDVLQDRVSEVIARKKTSYKADGVEMTPGQLLERLGFSSAHLSARVFELSGGQRRRLQFLLELLEEPNVLLLDEPTNDLDTDMLRAMEDLLDTWPGTLIVVSHDRYLLERVTDQQYAILDGEFRHLPGGIDEYLRLENAQEDKVLREVTHASTGSNTAVSPVTAGLRPGSKEHREAEKEHRSLEKKIQAGTERLQKLDADLAEADHGDFQRLAELAQARQDLQAEVDALESRWLELGELLA